MDAKNESHRLQKSKVIEEKVDWLFDIEYL